MEERPAVYYKAISFTGNDGWELRDQPIAIYGREDRGSGLALELTGWSRDLIVCSDGPATLSAADRKQLSALNIPVREERIARLEGAEGQLELIVFVGLFVAGDASRAVQLAIVAAAEGAEACIRD